MKLPKELQKNKDNEEEKKEENVLLKMTENVNFFELFEDKKISSKVPTYKIVIYDALITLVIEKKLSYVGINSKGNLIFTYWGKKIYGNVVIRKISNQEIIFLGLWMMSHKFKKETISLTTWEEILNHLIFEHILTKRQLFDFNTLENLIFLGPNEDMLAPEDLEIYDFKDMEIKINKEKEEILKTFIKSS